MSGRAVENTITGYLREEINKKGLKAGQFISYTTEVGDRIEPDIVVENGGQHVVQAKMGEHSAMVEAMSDVYNSIKYLHVKGGFAVVYPAKLRKSMPLDVLSDLAQTTQIEAIAVFEQSDPRPLLTFKGTLRDLANWIVTQITQPPAYVEPDIDKTIKVLRNLAEYLTFGMRGLRKEELQKIFGGQSVFENILQYKSEEFPVMEMRRAAAYLLINQVMFYDILSKLEPKKFAEVNEDKLKRPSDLAKYFRKVLEVDYAATFGFNVVGSLGLKNLREVRKVIKNVRALAPEKIRHRPDLLGQLFHNLIPLDVRKPVAAYYTNVQAAHVLARITIQNKDAKVIDLATGSGGLLVASYQVKKSFTIEEGAKFDNDLHIRFVEKDLTGLDIMPFAAHLAAINLSLQAPIFHTQKVRIALWDSTELKPGMVIPSVSKELKAAYKNPTLEMFSEGELKIPDDSYVSKGSITFEGTGGEQFQLDKTDVVIMNPPFTRQERLPEEYKRHLDSRFVEYRKYLQGQLGLHGYFVFLADKFLKDEGRVALVIPATILRIQSFDGVRKLLTERYEIEKIIATWHRAAFSEATEFREILLVARKLPVGKEPAKSTKVIMLKRLPANLDDSREYADLINSLDDDNYEDDRIVSYAIPADVVRSKQANLFTLIAFKNKWLGDYCEKVLSQKTLKITEFLAKIGKDFGDHVKRGVETNKGGKIQKLTIVRDVNRAIKKDDAWVVADVTDSKVQSRNRFTSAKVRVPMSCLNPALRRVAGIDKMDITGSEDFVITNHFADMEKYFVKAWDKKKPKFWGVWRKYVEERLCNVCIVRRMDISAVGTCVLAIYSDTPYATGGMAWGVKIQKEHSKYLALWFNSTLNILQLLYYRKETRGAFLQMDEYVMEDMLVPDFTLLSAEEKKELNALFERTREVKFPSLLEQLSNHFAVRKDIDMTFMKILGVHEKDLDSKLDKLYDLLAEEILLLKQLMTGDGGQEEEEEPSEE